MQFGNFVLSGNIKHSLFIRAAAHSFFIRFVATLSLRDLRCFGFTVLAHNKGNQFAAAGAGRGKPRHCCIRYGAPGLTIS